MKAVIIGAGKEALHTIQEAKREGIQVAAMDGNAAAAGLKEADEAIIVNISHEEETIEAVKEIKPDFLLTAPIGRYLTTIGAVNDALSLPGISRKAAENCTDKWEFHCLLAKEGLRNCQCRLLKAEEEIKILGKDLQYPAVLKPRYGSGSRGIFVVTGKAELEKAMDTLGQDDSGLKAEDKRGLSEDYVLEECVAGDEYGVDGAIIGGQFYLVLLRKKENTPFPARQAVAYFSVLPQDDFYKEAKDYLEKVVKALKLDECLFHGDLIRTPEGPFAIEVSARPSGHNLHNLFTPLATGIDLAKEYICYRIGKSYSFIPKQTKILMIHYFDLEGRINKVPVPEEVKRGIEEEYRDPRSSSEEKKLQQNIRLIAWSCSLHPGEWLDKVSDGHSLMGRGYYVLEGKSQEGLKEAANKIKSLFW